MKKLPLLLLCILLMTGCVNFDKQSKMNAYFAILGQQIGVSELVQFKTEDGEWTNTVPSFNFSSDGGDAVLTFNTPTRWSIDKESVADWVTLSKSYGNGGIFNLKFNVQKNSSVDPRNTVIDLKSGDFTYHIRVYQEENDMSVIISDETNKTVVTVSGGSEGEAAIGIIPVEEGFSEAKPTVIEIEGVGNITFNAAATAAILANAAAEGATNVYFKVEDVTTTKPVPDADVVLEITMKTVDEYGVEVYREGNAAGEVTIEIPMGDNVAYVNSVTLVNDAGDPVEGGVVPGSEKIENGILSFKVNHFSKYAIDYITKDENVSVTGVSLKPGEITIIVGDPDMKLTATVAPEYATDKTVSWASDKTDIATVDQEGNVHAVAEGTATITVTTTDGSKTATCAVTVKAALPAGALKGEFSVSASKKVHFSKGNLWADGDKALHFETNQYSTTNSWDASHVSHFTWSSTVEAAVGDSNSGDNLFCDESHKVSVDGGDAIYYALSKDEWSYLFNNHTKKWASVNGKSGYVIAPDGFTGEIASSYADDAALAAAGNLVFLPAAGSRDDGSSVNNVGNFGIYWSSTALDSDGAYRVFFDSSDVFPGYDGYRDGGYSVRLVIDVVPAGSSIEGFNMKGDDSDNWNKQK